MSLFKIPTFDDNPIEGDTCCADIIRKFKGNGCLEFLENRPYCAVNIHSSAAFCSCLLDSISRNDSIRHLATTLAIETNSQIGWTKIVEALQTPDMKLSRTLRLWIDFFALRCNTRDEFLVFYSSVIMITHELKLIGSNAVKDQYFVRSFLAKSISCEELQTEVKRLLTDEKVKWDVILERINSDCRAKVSGKAMRSDVR